MRSDWALGAPPSRNGGSEEKPQRSPRKEGPEARRYTSVWSQMRTLFQGVENDQLWWMLPQLGSMERNRMEVMGPWQTQWWYPESILDEEMETQWIDSFVTGWAVKEILPTYAGSLVDRHYYTHLAVEETGSEELGERPKPMGPKLPPRQVWLQLLSCH